MHQLGRQGVQVAQGHRLLARQAAEVLHQDAIEHLQASSVRG